MLRLFPRNSVGAEIGVFKGEFSRELLSMTEPTELHLIDLWWVGYGEHYPDWGPYTDHGRLRTRDAFRQAEETAAPFQRRSRVTLHAGDGVEYLSSFPDQYFDWIYIDSSHKYEHTQRELEVAARKVKAHGLIAGHDWEPDPEHQHHGVYRAVQELIAIAPWEIAIVDRCDPAQWCVRRRRGA